MDIGAVTRLGKLLRHYICKRNDISGVSPLTVMVRIPCLIVLYLLLNFKVISHRPQLHVAADRLVAVYHYGCGSAVVTLDELENLNDQLQ